MTDDIADPQGAGRVHSEALIRLPRGFLCYRPPDDAPAVAPAADGPITFGSFNNLSKVRPNVIAVWAQILNRVPGARLLVKSAQLANAERAEHLRDAFAAHGVEASRIEAAGQIHSKSGHLDAYRRLDIALDPFPYNGTTTTFEALWMGVPVITLAGDRHAARVGATILRRLGLDDYVLDDEQAYVNAAVALAGDASRRAELRGALRETLTASPLCDAAGFARDVEAAYRRVWRRWCADNG
jgi:predicted O-linked N-acetylglucosamine transferase (SPINDLY family)